MKCQEVITTCGTLKYDITITPDDDNEGYYEEKELNYYPQIFYPCIHLFNLPTNLPIEIKDELIRSFSLYWVDSSSCGNSIRKVIERIIDDIAPNGVGGLHNKIESLPSNYSDLKVLLLASKWIGNDGSHVSELKVYDTLLAFEFIEKCLIVLYEEKSKDLNSIASIINQKRIPLSKIPSNEWPVSNT